MPSNLLIISHLFPPTPGIGGRRWSKFSKYLKREGYKLTIIRADAPFIKESEWTSDVQTLDVKTLPYHFPKVIAYPKRGFINKLHYFSTLLYLKCFVRGNYFDKSIFWKDQIQKKVSQFIENNNINCVIVSGGPFRLTHHVVSLKQKFYSVKFIVDFRDYWTNDTEITAFAGLDKKRIEFEKRLELETIQMADQIICVATTMKDYFSKFVIPEKIAVIPNGFDPDDFEEIKEKTPYHNSKIKLVFAGTLYINLEYIMIPFLKGLKQFKNSYPSFFQKLEFEFIGSFPKAYKEIISEYDLSSSFNFIPHLPLKDVYRSIQNADFCLLFLNDLYNFALSTKFCEYISQRKKIIVVGNKGEAAEFIEKHHLGFAVAPDNCFRDLNHILNEDNYENNKVWNSDFDINSFSLAHLTNKLISVIEEKK